MNRLLVLLLALIVSAAAFPPLAQAQTKYSIFDPIRLGGGVSVNREWAVASNAAGTDANWRIGIPLSWEITSPNDPNVKHPFSLTALVDYKILATDPQNSGDRWRFHVGGTLAWKIAGRPL